MNTEERDIETIKSLKRIDLIERNINFPICKRKVKNNNQCLPNCFYKTKTVNAI